MTQTLDTLFQNACFADGTSGMIAVNAGRIAAIGEAAKGAARTVVDLGGALIVPGFVEGHIHLDTSFYGDAWKPHKPCTAGFDVHERVEFQRQNMAAAAPMDERARNQLELCISHGTTHMRSHVMVDATVGLPRDDPGRARAVSRRDRHTARRLPSERHPRLPRHGRTSRRCF